MTDREGEVAGDLAAQDDLQSGDEVAQVNDAGSVDATLPGRNLARRRAGFACGRAFVVVVVAAVLYEVTVPSSHADRSRLARLVPSTSGLAAFAKAHPQAGEQDDTQTGLAALTAEAKRSPDRTGIYSVAWSASQTAGVGVVAFLLPDERTAQTTLAQIRTQQMGTSTYATNSLDRTATSHVAGIADSYAATFEPSEKAPKGTPSLAIDVFRYGQIDAMAEAAGATSDVDTEASWLATREHALLQGAGGHFSMISTEYPVGVTAGWAAATTVLAAGFALVPVQLRRRREKRRLAYEQEMANRIVVKGQVITKHRR